MITRKIMAGMSLLLLLLRVLDRDRDLVPIVKVETGESGVVGEDTALVRELLLSDGQTDFELWEECQRCSWRVGREGRAHCDAVSKTTDEKSERDLLELDDATVATPLGLGRVLGELHFDGDGVLRYEYGQRLTRNQPG